MYLSTPAAHRLSEISFQREAISKVLDILLQLRVLVPGHFHAFHCGNGMVCCVVGRLKQL